MSTIPSTRLLALLVSLVLPLLPFLAAQEDVSGCTVGTLEENCVSASKDDEFFFCTDRYSWEWSQDAEQLPVQASDSLCLTMDSSVITDLDETELLVLGGCDAESQEIEGDCQSLSNSTRTYDPALDVFRENQAMPTERFRAAAVNVTEHVYLFGGRNAAGVLVRRGSQLLSYEKKSLQQRRFLFRICQGYVCINPYDMSSGRRCAVFSASEMLFFVCQHTGCEENISLGPSHLPCAVLDLSIRVIMVPESLQKVFLGEEKRKCCIALSSRHHFPWSSTTFGRARERNASSSREAAYSKNARQRMRAVSVEDTAKVLNPRCRLGSESSVWRKGETCVLLLVLNIRLHHVDTRVMNKVYRGSDYVLPIFGLLRTTHLVHQAT
ncbi:unnamed protein product [Scytosiphon promiscuus]